MTTRNQTIGDEWEEVSTADEFIVQVTNDEPCYFAFASSLPADSLAGHRLDNRQALTRNGILGNLYAKAQSGETVIVIISEYTA